LGKGLPALAALSQAHTLPRPRGKGNKRIAGGPSSPRFRSCRANENTPSASTLVKIVSEGRKDRCPSDGLKANSRAGKFVNLEWAAKKSFRLQVSSLRFDEFVKSRNPIIFVIPAKAGIQLFQDVLDPGFRRGDDDWDFLRDHQV